jgi:predicted nucleic acid-binding protein
LKVFLDTSALVKRYVTEPGSEEIEAVLGRATEVIISWILPVELTSALNRRVREKSLTPEEKSFIEKGFRLDRPNFTVVTPDEPLLGQACHAVTAHGLCTLDAIQYASYRRSHAQVFYTADKRLWNGVKSEAAKVTLV